MGGKTTLEQLYGFVDDLESSLDFDPGRIFDCDNILLCGVGGSAVSGDFAADCCYSDSRIPIILMKYPDLPNWVGKRTLAVVSSYSGNTAETLEMYRQAASRGCTIVAITSGGVLRALAMEDGHMICLLPSDMHPRHAIGYMIGYTLAVIRAAGGPDVSSHIRSFIPALRRYRDEVAIPDGCMARQLAREYEGKVPVICSEACMQSVAFRWKTQINENSKFVAFCESIPVFCNQLTSWTIGGHDNYLLTMLVETKGCSAGMHEALSMLEGSGIRYRIVPLDGESMLENMFRAIILGDYMSIYMAEGRGIDPAEVPPVMQMKHKLAAIRGGGSEPGKG